jgi:hypothetical protein
MMKKVCIALVLSILTMSAGCTKAVRYSAEEIRDCPPEIQEQIKKGEISIGMTMPQVRYAWGGPDQVIFLTPGEDGKERVEWLYQNTPLFKTRLIFTGGLLTGILSSQPGSIR